MLTLQSKLIGVVILMVALFGAYHWIGGHAVSEYKQEQAILQAKADKAQQDKYNAIAKELEDAKANREVVFKTITKTVNKVVEKEVYRNVCIDTEGLDVANAALEGKLP